MLSVLSTTQKKQNSKNELSNFDRTCRSEKYNKTQNQIILNWIIKEKKIIPLIKSTNIGRIDENNGSLSFEMEKEDYEKLTEFRSKEFDDIVIDWADKGGIPIDQLANQFE